MIEDAPLLTKTVKINQSEGIPGSGISERTFVKNSYKRSRTSLPSPPLLFIAFFTSHRSPLSERLEQATSSLESHSKVNSFLRFHYLEELKGVMRGKRRGVPNCYFFFFSTRTIPVSFNRSSARKIYFNPITY